jgi:hypothetical protein
MKTFFNLSKIVIASICLIATTTFYSCKKEGTGGKSSANGYVKHHSNTIPNAVVYIKYGATEFPGTDLSVYDNHVTTDANAHYEFKELRKGNYFLYGVGYDKNISREVKGGIGIQLKRNNTVTTDVPVTED